MPSDLANLLIRVTSVGFDEVLQNLSELEEAIERLGQSSGLDQVSRYLKDIHGDMAEMTEGFKKVTDGWKSFGDGVRKSGQELEDNRQKLDKHVGLLSTLAKAYASFWVMFNAPKKMFSTLDGIAQFNRQLSTMSVMAMMSRESLIALGAAVGKFGGSAAGIASLANRGELAMQGMRMAQGGGAYEEVAALYGLSLQGSGAGGLMTGEESLRNIVQLFERVTDKASRLDIKSKLGIDDATFQQMLLGLKAWDSYIEKDEKLKEKLKGSKEETEKWNESTSELKKEWEVLKTQVFVELGPQIRWIVDNLKEALVWLQEHKKTVAYVVEGVTAVATAIGLWNFAKHIPDILRILGILKKTKEVADGIGGGIAGGIPDIGGGKGGGKGIGKPSIGGGATGLVSLGVESISAGANIADAVFSAEMSNDLRTIANILVSKSTSGEDLHIDKMFVHVTSRLDGIKGILDSWNGRFEDEEEAKSENTSAMVKAYQEGRLDDPSFSNGGGKGVYISMNIGTLQSSAENYSDLVKELLDKAKSVTSDRLEVADWIDSNSGVIMA